MQGLNKRMLTALITTFGVAAGIASLGWQPEARGVENDAQTRPSNIKVDEANDTKDADRVSELRADVIQLRVDGKPGDPRQVITAEGVDVRQLTALVRSHKPGETIALAVIREGKPITLKVTLGERQEIAGEGPNGEEGPGQFLTSFCVPPGVEAPAARQELGRWIFGLPTPPAPPGPQGPGVLNFRRLPGEPTPPGGGTPLKEPKPESLMPGQPPSPGALAPPPRSLRRQNQQTRVRKRSGDSSRKFRPCAPPPKTFASS